MRASVKILCIAVVITVLFCAAAAFNVSPFLRGPAPYYPDWRWDYNFVNTYSKIWAPIAVGLALLYVFYKSEKKGNAWNKLHEKRNIFLVSILGYGMQFALLFANRAGINGLLSRIINPDVNGYFSSALLIKNVPDFLHTFNQNVLELLMHAQGHPPFSVLFFWVINNAFLLVPRTYIGYILDLPIKTPLIKSIWDLLPYQAKAGALFSVFFIPLLVVIAGVILYFLTKKLYGRVVALRILTLYFFIPNILLFTPINDVFIALFPLVSFLILLFALDKKSRLGAFSSGLIFSIGLYFSISLLPLLLPQGIVVFYPYLKKLRTVFDTGLFFIIGILSVPIALFLFFGLNSIEMVRVLVAGLPENRSYIVWVFYNLYDFFVFSGLPLAVLFFVVLQQQIYQLSKKHFKKPDVLFLSFFVMLMVVNFSGSVRGETGRIWIPYVPYLLLPLVNFVTHEKRFLFSTRQFVLFLVMQFVVVLILNEYWVALW